MMKIMTGHKNTSTGIISYHLISLILIAGCFSLAGCQNFIKKKTTSEVHTAPAHSNFPVSAAKPEAEQVNDGIATTCQKELVSLATINPSDYDPKRRSFEMLLHSANEYRSVRQSINAHSREIMDSFYKFKLMNLCSEIELSLQRGLIGMEDKRGEY
ncbi:hypothetical protein [Lelliottia wanjuensis]|uniref:hypothetical protein n=1 Tax=Lelliottia wanjuensis TaxID=3050585 RepID=UPI002550516B|nr:hypothetical protein [Lelliottia sp. V86_10]MDK9584436.1 hypothetical protein [Lelliottia sp. V86_10]